ncbi:hypothetical protein LCGC14_2656280 [marine sediment metagenome]|uniref:Uncharacterized protein n=1 Tax=marine sediment metagenome TaxID=412755 RepID=A0A0F9CKC4_9ZZZZ
MATTAVTPTPLVVDTVSGDLPASSGVVADTPADGWVVAAPVSPDTDVLLVFLGDAGGDATVTVLVGDRPPSHRSGLPLASFALAALDVKYLIVDKSRFLQDDGTIIITCVDAGTKLFALTIPKVQ